MSYPLPPHACTLQAGGCHTPSPPMHAPCRLVDVIPYIARLAFTERGMYWRLSVAFLCLVVSKGAGEEGGQVGR